MTRLRPLSLANLVAARFQRAVVPASWKLAATLLSLLLATALPAQEAATPTPRNDDPLWVKRHALLRDRVRKGGADIVFLGDATVQGFEGAGKEAWKKHFEPLKALNLGVGGDRTENLLWRLGEGGALDGLKPKVCVVQVGASNLAKHGAADIAAGVTAVVRSLSVKAPEAKVLVVGLLPRGARPADKYRDKVKEVNAALAKLDDGKKVRVVDVGAKLLDAQGGLPEEMSPDGLHLSAKGYQTLAEALAPVLGEMLKAPR